MKKKSPKPTPQLLHHTIGKSLPKWSEHLLSLPQGFRNTEHRTSNKRSRYFKPAIFITLRARHRSNRAFSIHRFLISTSLQLGLVKQQTILVASGGYCTETPTMSQKPITVPPPPAGILRNSPRLPVPAMNAKSDGDKCSVHTKNGAHATTKGNEGESEQSNCAACGEWLSCICGGIYFVICWTCALSGEVKSHKEIRRGSANAAREGGTASCTCGRRPI
ncbi:uncharacterized protein DFL_005797 [Arthrobotrys flagrans]|uniref:Uncharacterized protein n=1 Tax=Arthrobotrys flagrans TaxID=97331 RepID=A0A436ZYK1_ARTFL|nr:hypothetical protein DFL_005797 [Arthrobotrys flagrans]